MENFLSSNESISSCNVSNIDISKLNSNDPSIKQQELLFLLQDLRNGSNLANYDFSILCSAISIFDPLNQFPPDFSFQFIPYICSLSDSILEDLVNHGFISNIIRLVYPTSQNPNLPHVQIEVFSFLFSHLVQAIEYKKQTSKAISTYQVDGSQFKGSITLPTVFAMIFRDIKQDITLKILQDFQSNAIMHLLQFHSPNNEPTLDEIDSNFVEIFFHFMAVFFVSMSPFNNLSSELNQIFQTILQTQFHSSPILIKASYDSFLYIINHVSKDCVQKYITQKTVIHTICQLLLTPDENNSNILSGTPNPFHYQYLTNTSLYKNQESFFSEYVLSIHFALEGFRQFARFGLSSTSLFGEQDFLQFHPTGQLFQFIGVDYVGVIGQILISVYHYHPESIIFRGAYGRAMQTIKQNSQYYLQLGNATMSFEESKSRNVNFSLLFCGLCLCSLEDFGEQMVQVFMKNVKMLIETMLLSDELFKTLPEALYELILYCDKKNMKDGNVNIIALQLNDYYDDLFEDVNEYESDVNPALIKLREILNSI